MTAAHAPCRPRRPSRLSRHPLPTPLHPLTRRLPRRRPRRRPWRRRRCRRRRRRHRSSHRRCAVRVWPASIWSHSARRVKPSRANRRAATPASLRVSRASGNPRPAPAPAPAPARCRHRFRLSHRSRGRAPRRRRARHRRHRRRPRRHRARAATRVCTQTTRSVTTEGRAAPLLSAPSAPIAPTADTARCRRRHRRRQRRHRRPRYRPRPRRRSRHRSCHRHPCRPRSLHPRRLHPRRCRRRRLRCRRTHRASAAAPSGASTPTSRARAVLRWAAAPSCSATYTTSARSRVCGTVQRAVVVASVRPPRPRCRRTRHRHRTRARHRHSRPPRRPPRRPPTHYLSSRPHPARHRSARATTRAPSRGRASLWCATACATTAARGRISTTALWAQTAPTAALASPLPMHRPSCRRLGRRRGGHPTRHILPRSLSRRPRRHLRCCRVTSLSPHGETRGLAPTRWALAREMKEGTPRPRSRTLAASHRRHPCHPHRGHRRGCRPALHRRRLCSRRRHRLHRPHRHIHHPCHPRHCCPPRLRLRRRPPCCRVTLMLPFGLHLLMGSQTKGLALAMLARKLRKDRTLAASHPYHPRRLHRPCPHHRPCHRRLRLRRPRPHHDRHHPCRLHRHHRSRRSLASHHQQCHPLPRPPPPPHPAPHHRHHHPRPPSHHPCPLYPQPSRCPRDHRRPRFHPPHHPCRPGHHRPARRRRAVRPICLRPHQFCRHYHPLTRRKTAPRGRSCL